MSKHQFERYFQGYAVIRTDRFGAKASVKVVKVMLDQASAAAEVERLTAINGGTDVTYEWQATHVFSSAGSATEDPRPDTDSGSE